MTDDKLREIARKHGLPFYYGESGWAPDDATLAALREAYEAGAGQYRQDAERLDWMQQQFGCALLHDDNRHWAVSWDGIQTVPMSDGPEDVATSFTIYKDDWKDSVRAAIDAARGKDAAQGHTE